MNRGGSRSTPKATPAVCRPHHMHTSTCTTSMHSLLSVALQVSSHLKGRVLLSVSLPAPWERVAQLDFGQRPGEAPSNRLYCEIMAK